MQMMRLSWVVLGLGVVCTAACAAAPKSVTIRDYIGTAWRDELVHYPLSFAKGEMTGVATARVTPTGGKAIPCQISDVVRYDDGSVRSCKVWFFVSLPADGEASFTITPGAKGPIARGVSVKQSKTAITLTTRAPKTIGIRLPAGAKTYAWPVAASEVPGPIQALLLPSGKTLGPGRWEVPFRVRSYRAEVIANGPLFAEARVRYVFDNGYWTFRAKVLRGCAMIVIEEELDTGYNKQKWDQVDRFYTLPLTGGSFKPTQGFYGGRAGGPEFSDLVKQHVQPLLRSNEKVRGGAGTIANGYTLSMKKPRVDYYLMAAPTWSPRVGVCTRFVAPGGDAVGFAALNVMKWRNPMSLRFRVTEAGELVASLPLQVYEQHWPSEGYGRYSPNATGKTLGVGENTARRHYGIMLSPAEDEMKDPMASLIAQAVRLGSHPLDEVKDWSLDWPDPMAGAKWAAKTSAAGKQALAMMREWRDWKRNFGHWAPWSMWNHRLMTHRRYAPLSTVINSPGALTAADRKKLRRLCAYQAYVLNSLEHFPWGAGCHLGNPNMSIMAVNARVKSSLLVRDHPMFTTWGRWTLAFMKDYLRRYTRSSGATYENAHYTLGVTLTEIAESNQVFMDSGIGDAFDTELFRKCIRFCLDWSAPPDPRFGGHRMILPIGNGASYPSVPPKFTQILVNYYKSRNPKLAGQLQWVANQSLPASMQVRIVKDIVPKLDSVHHADYGVFMRHGFGTPYETLFFLLAGNCDGHNEWETDQMAYTLYAKGQPIHLTFANGYHPMFCRPWLRNRISFDHQIEQSERSVTKIAAVAFTPEAEYTRAIRTVDRIRPLKTEYPVLGRNGMSWAAQERQSWPGIPKWEEIPLTTWHRQVVFVKDADPKGPNYFVLRDTFSGTPTKPTDLSLWFLADAMKRTGNLFQFTGQCDVDMDVFVASPTKFTPATGEYGHPQHPYRRWVPNEKKYHTGRKWAETQKFLRITQPAGKGYLVVLYPRLKKVDPPAKITRLDESVVKVVTPLSTDYVLVNSHRFAFKDAKVQFDGQAATVRFYKTGKVTLTNGEGAATITAAGKTVTGTGPFTVTITGGKVARKTFAKGARVTVR